MRTRCLIVSTAMVVALASYAPDVVAAPKSAAVPLELVPIGQGQYKVGIKIRLGGGPPRLYTFDTGSSGFYAAYDQKWWPKFTLQTEPPYYQSYGDGVVLESLTARTTVGIPSNRGLIKANVEVGLIVDAWGGQLGPRERSQWFADLAAGNPPLFGTFYGDFGSGLREVGGLFAVLPQLPGNLSSGFAVQLGCRDPSTGTLEPRQKLRIGLTKKIRSRATSWVPMQKKESSQSFPNGNPTYAQALLAAHLSLSSNDKAPYAFSMDAILDTGAPTTVIRAGSDLAIPPDYLESPQAQTRIAPGNTWSVTADGTQIDNGFGLSLVTGETVGIDQINVTRDTGSTKSEVNLGLIPFFRYDVIFDIERGLLGFAPSCSL